MNPINFEAKTDRELLLLTASWLNQLTEETVPTILAQLKYTDDKVNLVKADVEVLKTKVSPNLDPPSGLPFPSSKMLSLCAGGGAAIAGAIYGIGKAVGWW